MKKLLVGAVVLLGGCASAHSFTAPDGRRAFTTICERNWETKASCHEYARKACGGNYDVLREDRYSLDVACEA